MKRIIKWKVLLSLCCIWLAATNTKAQLTNQSFENWCGYHVTLISDFTDCETVENDCVDGWYRSHGTPQLWSGSAPNGNNYFAMWSKNTGSGKIGEGIFTYKNFSQNTKYRVCMWVHNDVNLGEIIVRLSKNLTPQSNTEGDCGEDIPSGANTQIVYQTSFNWNTAWTKVTFDFVANDNYSQFWVYPNSDNSGNTVWLYIDDINLYEVCNDPIVFNMTTHASGVIPSAFYAKKYTIDAGSTAGGGTLGAGTVTNSTAGDVIFEGGSLVRLLPNFRATATANAKFVAFITPCSTTECISEDLIFKEPNTDKNEPLYSIAGRNSNGVVEYTDNKISVYPNPTTGTLRLTAQYDAVCEYELTTITGQVLQKGTVQTNQTLDITEFSTGIYLLKITEGITGQQSTHKIVKE